MEVGFFQKEKKMTKPSVKGQSRKTKGGGGSDKKKAPVPPRKKEANALMPPKEPGNNKFEKKTKMIMSNHRAARVYWLSCLLPEATKFKVNELPCIEDEEGVMRILVICGNLSHFSGDIGDILIEHWISDGGWNHVIFVPGPIDYGSGPVELGDAYLETLQETMGHDKFTVFSPSVLKAVAFLGPALRFVGAPCWPVDNNLYKQARVYEMPPGIALDDTGMATAVADKNFLSDKTAQKRLIGDAAIITMALIESEDVRHAETRIVVSYGCPDEKLTIDVPSDHIYRGAVALGSSKFYKYFQGQVDYWLCGAQTDRPRATMGKIQVWSNQYREAEYAFDEPISPTAGGLWVERKITAKK